MNTSRSLYLDAARGLAIVLVAFGHATMVLVDAGLSSPQWFIVTQLALAVRMPLFFVVAGMLASGVVKRSWRELWNSRIALLLWIIFVWTMIRLGWFTILPIESLPHYGDPLLALVSPVWATGAFWFLQALVVFLIASKIMIERVPVWAQLTGAALVSAIALGMLAPESVGYQRAAAYFVFFLLGLHCRRLVMSLAERPRPFVATALIACVLATSVAVFAFDADRIPGVLTVLGVPAVLAAMLTLRAFDGARTVRVLGALGRRALPVFVLHMLIIGGVTNALLALPELPVAVRFALPPVLGVVSVVLSLAIWRLTRQIPALYSAPRFMMIRAPKGVLVD